VTQPPPTAAPAGTQRKRRVPQQSRSRERVERILDTAARLVVDDGVDRLSTRGIAERAQVPVASLYQYFADKDDILLALVERDIAEMDAQVEKDLAELTKISVATLVETTIRAFVRGYHRRPAFVVLWMRGRTNQAINEFCRIHNRQLARRLFAMARETGLLDERATSLHADLAVEVADRLFQVAFEDTFEGDALIIDESISLVTSYLERHATLEGIQGIAL
jgi:AcrR family transcriptional regulator